jgi:ElaA protein
MDDVSYFYGTAGEINAANLYRLLTLRSRVFVVARRQPWLDPDGRDIEPGTTHLWAECAGETIATLRLTDEGDGVLRMGRVCTLLEYRRQGHATMLVRHALVVAGVRPVIADVYARSADWFTRRGFQLRGGRTVVDGEAHTSIQHVPAARHAAPTPAPGNATYRPAWAPV